jgi:hypothetical protein
MRSGLSRRAVAVGGALLGLTAIVALASRARGPGGGSTRTVSTDWLLEYLLLLVGLTFAAALIAGIYLVVTAHQGGKWTAPPRSSWWRTLVTLVVFLAVVFLLVSSLHRANVRNRPLKPSGSPSTERHRPIGGSKAHFDWAPVGVVGGIVLVGLGAVAWILIRRRTPKKVLTEGLDPDALIAALDDSLDDLRNEPDPRLAVIAAYARMERALAFEGLARRKAEAPREYLARTLPALGAGAGSVARLTALFEEAKFSPHDVDAGMKDAAIQALETLRDELRAASAAGRAAEAVPA